MALTLAAVFVPTQDVSGQSIELDGATPTKLTDLDSSVLLEQGARRGPNLFHSFARFSIEPNQEVTFGYHEDGIENVVARVTGEEVSSLLGTLSSTIGGADLFLFNPNGIYMGSEFEVNVDGTFHASTADLLRFADGVEFRAGDKGNPVLTTASPTAFGFLAGNSGDLHVDGSRIAANAGSDIQGLHLSSTNIRMSQALLAPDRGAVELVGAAPGSHVPLGLPRLAPPGAATPGIVDIERSTIAVSSSENGRVRIRGGRVELDQSTITATARTFQETAIRLEAGDAATNNARLLVIGQPFAFGGKIEILASGNVTDTGSTLSTLEIFGGRLGDVIVEGAQLNLARTRIVTPKIFAREGGDIRLTASGRMDLRSVTLIASTDGGSDGGLIRLRARDLYIGGGKSEIQTETSGKGRGGNIDIEVTGSAHIDDRTAILNGSSASGRAGDSRIVASTLTVSGGTRLVAGSESTGAGGNIDIEVDGLLRLTGDKTIVATSTSATVDPFDPNRSIDAGNVSMTAADIVIENGAAVVADTSGEGAGGNLTLTASRAIVLGGGAAAHPEPGLISARSLGNNDGAGPAGEITLAAADVTILQGGEIATSTVRANAGGIKLDVSGTVLLDGGTISTSVADGAGAGGDINIDPFAVILFNGRILANAARGAGGNITIVTQNFFADSTSVLDASSEESIDGVITIRSPDTDLTDSLVNLPSDFVDAAQRLASACAERGGQVTATLVAGGRGGLPVAPGGPMVSDFATGPALAPLAASAPPTDTIATGARAAHGESDNVIRLAGSGSLPVTGALECIV